jgi:hypothetical protein
MCFKGKNPDMRRQPWKTLLYLHINVRIHACIPLEF